MNDLPLLSPAELAAMLRDPAGRELFSPLGQWPMVLLDIEANAGDDALTLCRQHILQLPCPVIGVGESGSLAAFTDARVTSMDSARSLVSNILAQPLAAMTLVQLLRHNERATLEQGLLAESLAYATLQGGAEFHRWLEQRTPATRADAAEADIVKAQRVADTLQITLNRPRERNAFSRAMRDQLWEVLLVVDADPRISTAVISGAGSCFSIGGDLTEFGTFEDTASAHAIRSTRHVGRLIHQLRGRVECRLHRACIGAGIELPAFAGNIVARHNSFFQLPELSLGLIPGAGGTVSLLRRIGRQRTAWLALSGRRIGAEQALDWGLIDRIEPR